MHKKRKSHLSNIIHFMFILVSFNFLNKLNVPEIMRRFSFLISFLPLLTTHFLVIWQMDFRVLCFLMMNLLICSTATFAFILILLMSMGAEIDLIYLKDFFSHFTNVFENHNNNSCNLLCTKFNDQERIFD